MPIDLNSPVNLKQSQDLAAKLEEWATAAGQGQILGIASVAILAGRVEGTSRGDEVVMVTSDIPTLLILQCCHAKQTLMLANTAMGLCLQDCKITDLPKTEGVLQ